LHLSYQSKDTICNTQGRIEIVASPPGGTLSGKGVVGNFFEPDSAVLNQYNVFTYILDSSNCSATTKDSIYVELCVGISQLKVNNKILTIMPNPNNGSFTLEYQLLEGQSGKLTLYNALSEMVGEYELTGSQGKMEITNYNLSNGVYFYKVNTNTNVVKVGKIVIIK
jgi:hypothetical protein